MSKKVKAGEEEIQRKRKSVAAEKPEEEKEVKEVVEKTTPAKKGKGKKDVATPPAQKKQKKEEKEEEPEEEEEEKEEESEEEEEEEKEEDESNENKAFVWGLPETFNEEKLGELFKDCKVLAVKVPANRMDAAKCKGFGFVTFESAEEMAKALTKFEGRNVEGREIHLKQAEGKKEDAVSKTKVFVYGVGTDATEESVTALFKKCGSIVDVHIPKSREDETKAKGFAFVTFETEEAVKKCMEMNGKEVNGVALSIKTAAPRQSRPTRGRGRGGFRGGFRGGRGGSSEGRPAGGRGGFRGRGRGGFRGGRGRGSSRGGR